MKSKKVLIISLAAVALLTILICIGAAVLGGKDKGGETPSATDTAVSFPQKLDKGLSAENLFPSDILNPDCNWEQGYDVASLEIKNTSDKHIEKAEITLTLASGEKLVFVVEELPQGASVWAFETSNTALPKDFKCVDIKTDISVCEPSLMEDELSLAHNGISVSFSNLTDNEISGLTASFHCLMDDIFYGGKAFRRDVEAIAPHQNVTVNITECVFGNAQTVRLYRDKN